MSKRAEQFVPRSQLSHDELWSLIRARRQSAVALRDLAAALGVSMTALDNYEAGRRRPPVAVLDAWRMALGQSVAAKRLAA